MVAIEFGDVYGPCLITSLSAIQQVNFHFKLERARRKLKITSALPNTFATPTVTAGAGAGAVSTTSVEEAAFERLCKAYHNSVEFYPMFLGCMWSSSLAFHQGASVTLGLVYVTARSKYFRAVNDSEQRKSAKFSLFSLFGMSVCVLIGVGTTLLKKLLGRNTLTIMADMVGLGD